MAVYWIRAGEAGPIKVGYAINPAARLKLLQTGSYLPLSLIRVESGDRTTEAALHQHYRLKRVHGEFFMLTEDDVAVDLSILFAPSNKIAGKVRRINDPGEVNFAFDANTTDHDLSPIEYLACFVSQIEAYCATHGITEGHFGRLVMDDNRFVGRLRAPEPTVSFAALERAYGLLADAPPPLPRRVPKVRTAEQAADRAEAA